MDFHLRVSRQRPDLRPSTEAKLTLEYAQFQLLCKMLGAMIRIVGPVRVRTVAQRAVGMATHLGELSETLLSRFPTRASRAKRFWMEAATTLGVSLETVEQCILKGALKFCDPRMTESSLRRFCRRNGSLINSDILNPETRSWLKDVMDLAPNAGKAESERLQASRKHASHVRKCGCGRTIRGNAFFRHSRKCQQATSG
jgi:hypothetical protein